MATQTGHVMNLANSIIGVSLLAMPFCFKQCGITLAIIMLLLSSIISRLACCFLVKSSTMCRRRNFEFLAFYTFGPSGKLLVELGIIGFMMGTCVAFFVVMGDLGPAIVSKIFNINNSTTLRTSVLISLGFLVVLPLGLLRNVESLAAISTVTIGFYFLFILKIFFESFPRLINGDWWYHVNFWRPEGILQCIPIFAMALSCQTQLFEIYESLSSPTMERINSVVHSALNLCTVVYTCVGLLGYIAYCKGSFTGNILLSFTPSISSEMFKLGFVMSIAVSFPLVIFPCRASLFSLIFKRVPIHHELNQTSSHIPDSRFKCLTIGIVSVALITGLLIPSIELVLGFVGSTIGIAICVIFPSLSFLCLNNKNTNECLTAKFTLVVGLVIMVTGTFGNLFAAVENKHIEPLHSKLLLAKALPQLKIPPIVDDSTEGSKRDSKAILLVNPNSPSQKSDLEQMKVKIAEKRRKEPPIPVAPDLRVQVNDGSNTQFDKKKTSFLREVSKKSDANNKKSSEVKPNGVINKDAIEKEEREIMEVEKQKMTEEDEKQAELLKRLKEHQDEQKKLLLEQEKILKEIKSRESEKKSNEISKKDTAAKKLGVLGKPVKSDDFKVNIKEIKISGNDLENNKSSLVKNKLKNDKESSPRRNSSISNEIPKRKGAETAEEVMLQAGSSISSRTAPQIEPKEMAFSPLGKRYAQPEGKSSFKGDPVKRKEELLSREILLKKKELEREKRDVNEYKSNTTNEGCAENDHSNKTEGVSEEQQRGRGLVKNLEHLSVNSPGDEKLKVADVKNPDILIESLISKKRDLKSVVQIS